LTILPGFAVLYHIVAFEEGAGRFILMPDGEGAPTHDGMGIIAIAGLPDTFQVGKSIMLYWGPTPQPRII